MPPNPHYVGIRGIVDLLKKKIKARLNFFIPIPWMGIIIKRKARNLFTKIIREFFTKLLWLEHKYLVTYPKHNGE